MKQYPYIASRFFGAPLLLEPRKAEVLAAVLQSRMGYDVDIPGMAPDLRQMDAGDRRRAGYSVRAGAAVVPLVGSLLARGDALDAMSGATTYNRFLDSVQTALDDDDVDRVVLDVSSSGGEAECCQAAADRVFAMRGDKPIIAAINERSASAAYWLSSAADEIVMTPASEAGSIGVIVTHMNVRRKAEMAGIEVTHIHAGSHKADFSPYKDLTEDMREIEQARIDELYSLFVAGVAQNRAMNERDVRATEARMYGATEAVRLGLADRIGSFDSLFEAKTQVSVPVPANAVAAATPSDNVTMSDTDMSGNQQGAPRPAVATPETDEQLRSAFPGLVQQIEASAAERATTAERERISAILSLPEAEGREPTVRALACQGSMTAEAAKSVLATIPQSVPATLEQTHEPEPVQSVGYDNQFVQLMKRTGNAAVLPDSVLQSEADANGEPQSDAEQTRSVLKSMGFAPVRGN